MNIRDLQYLIAVYEHGHFGKAAKACHISQPTLSMQLKKLEDTLGVPLIERNNKSMLMTETGMAIVQHARKILHEVEQIKAVAEQHKNPYKTNLTLGVIPTVGPYLLPIIISKLNQRFPELKIYLIEEKTEHLLRMLKEGNLDAALLALPIESEELHSTNIYDEPFLLAVGVTHPLAKRKKLEQREIMNEDIFLLADGHCMRDQALSICNKQHAKNIQDFTATSLETLRHMVTSGLGVTLMPKLACQFKDPFIKYIPFNQPIPFRKIGMIWRKTSVKARLLQEMTKVIEKALKDID